MFTFEIKFWKECAIKSRCRPGRDECVAFRVSLSSSPSCLENPDTLTIVSSQDLNPSRNPSLTNFFRHDENLKSDEQQPYKFGHEIERD